MRKPDEIDLATAVKLASLVVRCQEMLSPQGHAFDREAVRGLVEDAEIGRWLKSFDASLR